MKLLIRMLRFLFRPTDDAAVRAGEPESEAQKLRELIRKWEIQATEYERFGFETLARDLRESIRWHRLKLKTLTDPGFRRVA